MIKLPPYRQLVSFGDCDPAGIVFYPNIFRWMDAAFHNGLRPFGGHVEVCKQLGAIGLGLMNATASFRAPMRDGDLVELRPVISAWGTRSVTVDYEGFVGDVRTFNGAEVRGIFRPAGGRIEAGDIGELRQIFEAGPG